MAGDAFGRRDTPATGVGNGVDRAWHVRGQTLHLLARLRDHVERIDEGKAYAVDDLAVVLRAFLHPGRGNDVLLRLATSAGLTDTQVELSRAPAVGPDVRFSFGSVPTSYELTSELGGRKLTIEQWQQEPVAHVRLGSVGKTWSWAQLVSEYANKWGGTHLDEIAPQHLTQLDHMAVAGFGLPTYLLRAAAVEVWRIANHLLSSAVVAQEGMKLTEAELQKFRVNAGGGNNTDPADISSRGRFEWYEWTDTKADFLFLLDQNHEATAYVWVGLRYRMDVTLDGAGERTWAEPVVRPREPVDQPLKRSNSAAIQLHGRALSFQNLRAAAASGNKIGTVRHVI